MTGLGPIGTGLGGPITELPLTEVPGFEDLPASGQSRVRRRLKRFARRVLGGYIARDAGGEAPITIRTVGLAEGMTALDEPEELSVATAVPGIIRETDAERDGAAVLDRADAMLFIDAARIAKPTVQDQVTSAGQTYSVVKVDGVPDEIDPAFYKVELAR